MTACLQLFLTTPGTGLSQSAALVCCESTATQLYQNTGVSVIDLEAYRICLSFVQVLKKQLFMNIVCRLCNRSFFELKKIK